MNDKFSVCNGGHDPTFQNIGAANLETFETFLAFACTELDIVLSSATDGLIIVLRSLFDKECEAVLINRDRIMAKVYLQQLDFVGDISPTGELNPVFTHPAFRDCIPSPFKGKKSYLPYATRSGVGSSNHRSIQDASLTTEGKLNFLIFQITEWTL